jgi:dihydrodiol dehydrogenase / D-xylose 1-dehydrogenase (NADP)
MSRTIHWGIAGTGIAGSFVKGLRLVENAEIAAVASITKQDAGKFAKAHNIPVAYGNFEELAEDSTIDVVYVAVPHVFHKELAMMFLQAGKAVICEKPLAVNTEQAVELISYARGKKLFLMEAMWMRFFPVMRKLGEWLDGRAIGEVKMVKAEFGFCGDRTPEGRLLNAQLAGGSLLDVGIYPLEFSSMVFKTEPNQILSLMDIGETGVDRQCGVLLSYEKGRMALLASSICSKFADNAYIYGTDGYIHIPNYWHANSAVICMNEKEPAHYECRYEGNGYNYEAQEVMRCLIEGEGESRIMPLDESLSVVKTMDAIRRQCGLRYPFEKW